MQMVQLYLSLVFMLSIFLMDTSDLFIENLQAHSYYHHMEINYPSSPFYKRGLTLIPAWISNYTHYNVWDEITYPFLNFNGETVEV